MCGTGPDRHTYAGEWHMVSPSPPALTLHCRITQKRALRRHAMQQ
ncbi:hypothetical protein XHC_3405 [Xanthomonas hortorum pv. carotae str. M081]|nr:hypothetical protein XHC_3405 [Xanthomonas hortorum pv. carotae str. M081]